MCNCNKQGQAKTKWQVHYPDGTTEVKDSLASAQMAKARVPGAIMRRVAT
jgi:hypothetical protein